jgi:putative RNA 2'-phosphotransferase
MSDKEKKTSKFLSLVLRHEPQKAGLTLDEAGWVPVAELLDGCRRSGVPLTEEQLKEIVRGSDKQRFAFSEDGTRIRANQGHSVPVKLGYAPATPPEMLYHGTADKSLESIRRDGLHRGQRHHVHLSERTETAAAVGQRHGKLVMIEIRSGQMHRDGHTFYRTPNGVWLVDAAAVSGVDRGTMMRFSDLPEH